MTRLITALLIAPLTFVAPVAYADDHAKDLKLEDLPKATRDTVERQVKDGKIIEIDRDDDDGRAYYEVEFIQNQQRYEIHVAEDGKLLQRKSD